MVVLDGDKEKQGVGGDSPQHLVTLDVPVQWQSWQMAGYRMWTSDRGQGQRDESGLISISVVLEPGDR